MLVRAVVVLGGVVVGGGRVARPPREGVGDVVHEAGRAAEAGGAAAAVRAALRAAGLLAPAVPAANRNG